MSKNQLKSSTRFYVPDEVRKQIETMYTQLPFFQKPVDVLAMAVSKLYQEFESGEITIQTSTFKDKYLKNNQKYKPKLPSSGSESILRQLSGSLLHDGDGTVKEILATMRKSDKNKENKLNQL